MNKRVLNDPEVEMRVAARTALFLMSMGMKPPRCSEKEVQFVREEFKKRTDAIKDLKILKNWEDPPLDEQP